MYCLVPGVNLEINRTGFERVFMARWRRVMSFSAIFVCDSSIQSVEGATDIGHDAITGSSRGEE